MNETAKTLHPITADAVIIGGGLIGATQACALAMAGMRIVVIDRSEPEQILSAEFDGRASAIAQASYRLFNRLGLWEFSADETTPILDIRVSDGESLLFLHYDHADVGEQPLGYMIENRYLRRALYQRMAALDGVTLLSPRDIDSIETDGHFASVVLSDGTAISAPVLIGADGRSSLVRDAVGIGLTQWSYRQSGIVCTVAHALPHNNVANEHFLPAGPFAILPLPGNQSSIVWTESSELAASLIDLPEAEFTEELAVRFGDFLGALSIVGPRWFYPLSLQYAESTVATRAALIGDAAHALHPIAGQGFNMGLRDVAALTDVLVDAWRLGLDIGTSPVLEKYQRWRRFDTLLMAGLTDGLNRLFSNNVAP
ncbi:MAG: UbiH/UbiF/VisC/COQ6 family ubiquinone biosynthesis hydroxylase, partial [Proteobacteria bacterium]|nr:UbiH/UbiF/VisC/COQ6 family ubiquinone biosynthesis hydroxylase [Pseudomonadota bacterium]